MKFLILVILLGISCVDSSLAVPVFKPLLGTPQQGMVEMAVMGLYQTENYQEVLAAGERYHAIMLILSQVVANLESDKEKRRSFNEDEMTDEQRRFLADRDLMMEEFGRHSGESWVYWLGIAAVAHFVETGKLSSYPGETLELRAEEMAEAFEPLLGPMESGSLFGSWHEAEKLEER